MKIPNPLIIAAVLFWGWQTGFWIFAIPIAVLVLAAYWIPTRWDLTTLDFRQIATFCSVGFVGLTIYLLVSSQSVYFVYTLLQWLPAILSILLLAQIYSNTDVIDFHTFSSFRDRPKSSESRDRLQINLTVPYFAIAILAASVSSNRDISFYLGMFGLSAGVLWLIRKRSFSIGICLCILLVAGSAGFVTQIGLRNLQGNLEKTVIQWLSGDLTRNASDPVEKDTAIGDIGLIKLSNDILFRVAIDKQHIPIRLRESTYNRYNSSTWLAAKSQFTPIQPEADRLTWQFTKTDAPYTSLTISDTIRNGKLFLKMPQSTFQISQLSAEKLQKNQFGTIEIQGSAKAIDYQAKFRTGINVDSPPSNDDLDVPESEKIALDRIVDEIGLKGEPPKEILRKVLQFFNRNFQYSLNNVIAKDNRSTAISTFLLKQRIGHCEYFATAAALLLRKVGIPSRYAVGFSVSEYSALEGQYVARGRDAHAWTLAYINGSWQEFDTTPPDWTTLDKPAASLWESIADFWAFLGFKISGLGQLLQTSDLLKRWWWVILLALVGWLLFKGKGQSRRITSRRRSPKVVKSAKQKVTNSDFAAIEQALNARGFFRNPAEPLTLWIERINLDQNSFDELLSIIALYYRDRFDPLGISFEEREQLKNAIQGWLERYSS
ncbi:transglutaminase-like domain-containing protein [Pseudanabaena sp. BC1403]|uniref:transglutaminase-like domain-containing protein n=1 Tax=Pseudanabaena sp. BC1403 TaxID=2043171 RepID=UPI000CD7E99D|nr:transglutaminase-like domain-containing protein [Pseudanabaena sp. BC1403]